jgi:hypothetical protein
MLLDSFDVTEMKKKMKGMKGRNLNEYSFYKAFLIMYFLIENTRQ